LLVLFRCDAGREHGIGHVMRCLTLADAFRASGAEVAFHTMTGPGLVGRERIEARGFRCTVAAEPAGSDLDVAGLAGIKRDVLVIDSRRAAAGGINRLARQGFTVLIDDDGMTAVEADVVVNTGLEAASDRYPERGRRGADLLGPRYNLVDPALFANNGLAPTARRILVTFGGEDPYDHTGWFLRHFASALAGLEIAVVIGPAHPDAASPRRAAEAIGATVVESPASLAPYILNADLSVTAGGTTCFELAAAGVPMLAIAIEAHQRPLIASLARRHACIDLGTEFDIDPSFARNALHGLIADRDARATMRRAQQAIFPGPGAPLIVEAIAAAWRNGDRADR